MQANEDSKLFKNVFIYLGWILLALFLWFKGCGNDCGKTTTNVKVTIPEVTGSFKPKQPGHTPLVQNLNTEPNGLVHKLPTSGQLSSKGVHDNNVDSSNMDSLVNALLAENEKYSRMYYLASDSLKKVMYDKSIQLNYFNDSFEDKNVKIDFTGIVRGEVKSIQPFYTIKEREIDVPVKQKETVFRLLAGGGLGINKDLNQGLWKVNIGFQNPKGNILNAGYMKINGQDYGVFEYNFSLLKSDQ